MELANFWSWLSSKTPRRAPKKQLRRNHSKCVPHLQTLEDRSLLNGYIAIGAGAGAPPLVAIRVDKVDAQAGQPPNSAGQPPAPASDGRTDFTSQTFAAYDSRFLGGVHVATGNFDGFTDRNGDGIDDRPDYLVTAPGPGGGPHIKVWEMTQDVAGNITVRRLVTEFMAYDARFTGGVNITTGDLDGDGRAELILGAGPGGGPHVKIYKFDFSDQKMVLVDQFMAYDPRFRGGVSVAANMGYQVQTAYLQRLTADLPDMFQEVPYDPPESRPGFNADPALDIPLSGRIGEIQPDLTILPFGFMTVASGSIQYVGGNLLNNYGSLAYEPNVVDPTGNHNVPPEQPLVYASWNAMDPNIPAFATPDVVYGPFVQIVPAIGGNPAVVQPFTAPPGQSTPRDQLITGPGPGGGPIVRVWDFLNDAGGFRQNEMTEFTAFDPNDRNGINVSIGDFVQLPNPDPFTPFVRPDTTSPTAPQVTFPYSTDVYREFSAQIMVTSASGGTQAVVYADYNPFNDRRTSITQLNLVATYLNTVTVFDPNNPLNGFQSLQDLTYFGNAIDPQFRGQILSATSSLLFGGSAAAPSANQFILSPFTFNVSLSVASTLGLTRSQNVFAAGANPGNGPSRGTSVRIFDNLAPSANGVPNAVNNTDEPIDQFAAFTSGFFPNGVGGIAFGFGQLPMPAFDAIVLTPIAMNSITNPVYFPPN